MTEENYNYRTSQKLLRNQFPGKGKLKIPIIPKFQESPGDFDDLLLIGFDKTHLEDQNHLDRMVHFFLYDYCLRFLLFVGCCPAAEGLLRLPRLLRTGFRLMT